MNITWKLKSYVHAATGIGIVEMSTSQLRSNCSTTNSYPLYNARADSIVYVYRRFVTNSAMYACEMMEYIHEQI